MGACARQLQQLERVRAAQLRVARPVPLGPRAPHQRIVLQRGAVRRLVQLLQHLVLLELQLLQSLLLLLVELLPGWAILLTLGLLLMRLLLLLLLLLLLRLLLLLLLAQREFRRLCRGRGDALAVAAPQRRHRDVKGSVVVQWRRVAQQVAEVRVEHNVHVVLGVGGEWVVENKRQEVSRVSGVSERVSE